ncbi:DUF2057 family protein [Vibrio kanaloae]|uniref:DUF2057 domain-containing protein n=1 Tax=Vibrio kanaloae TaxID=170673 RepID=A0A4V5R1T2_9VIBR|nr:DUF2057 family protein [Vibrio kanaloae]KAB0464611.1 DUF2057 domain-containing protein [Vibrio kanaloae]TKF01044.1 DUF2057 domain-containing protein [Vibrio kanaloae]TKF19638.1 DUF2057 domain-containing protein [Vibrio kanaloae]TKF25034.1 DUF2057 domain-containing protein [Vibrio kanaloae]
MKRTIWTSILMALSALSVPNAYANTNSSTELDVAQGVEVLFINSQKKMDEPFMLTTGPNQIVLRMDTMLGRGEQRGNFTSAPYILTLDVNGGELEIDGPKLKDVLQARKVFEGDTIDWNVSLNGSDIDYDQIKMVGKKGMLPYSNLDEQLAIYNAANGISFAGNVIAPVAAASLVNGKQQAAKSVGQDSLEMQKAKMSYLKLSPTERKSLRKWLVDQQ